MAHKRLKFEEGRHLYTLDGKPLTGVTTILSIIAKPALIQWAANEACDYIWNNGRDIDLDDLQGVVVSAELLKEARTAHRRKKEASADTGTMAHKWIERWIKGENPERDELIAPMTDNFVKWATDNNAKFLASEKQVFSEKYWFAGTLDFICEVWGMRFIGDVKTSTGIYDEMFFQTSAYQLALHEMLPNVKIDGHIILNCKKDGGFQVKKSFDYDKNIKAFLGALDIYRRKGELERNDPKKKYKNFNR